MNCNKILAPCLIVCLLNKFKITPNIKIWYGCAMLKGKSIYGLSLDCNRMLRLRQRVSSH